MQIVEQIHRKKILVEQKEIGIVHDFKCLEVTITKHETGKMK